MPYTTIPQSYIDAVTIPRAFGQLTKDNLDNLQARLTTVESGLSPSAIRVKYLQTTTGQPIPSGADTLLQFPVAATTNALVTPSGTNNNTFALGIGNWLIFASTRLSNGGAWQMAIATGTTFNVNNVIGGGGAGVFNGCGIASLAVTSGTTNVCFNIFQSGAATNVSTGFGQITQVTFFRIGN